MADGPMTPLRFESVMNDADAVLWTIERDPVLRTPITAIAMLDSVPDVARLRRRLEEAIQRIPRLRQRVVPVPGHVLPPRWVDAPADLDYHLRLVGAPPGGLRGVLDLAAAGAMAGFDRARPLWEMTLVSGLEGERAALIQKLHHVFTDGEGAIQLALVLLDRERDPDRTAPAGAAAPSPASFAAAVRAAMHQELSNAPAVAGAARGGLTTARSVARVLRPVREPLSPIMRGRGLSWRFDAFDVPLGMLKEAARHGGGTVNDAFLAAVTGGLRRYHEAHGTSVDELRMTMPVSFRRPEDPVGNNRFAPARFAVPVSMLDPTKRMREISRISRSWQAEPSLALTDVLAAALYHLPASVTTTIFGSMLKNIDFVATNVAGVPFPVYLAGAEVEREYAFAPPSGAALNVALLSHAGTACIGLVEDRTAIPDGAALVDALRGGFEEVLATVPAVRRRRAAS